MKPTNRAPIFMASAQRAAQASEPVDITRALFLGGFVDEGGQQVPDTWEIHYSNGQIRWFHDEGGRVNFSDLYALASWDQFGRYA